MHYVFRLMVLLKWHDTQRCYNKKCFIFGEKISYFYVSVQWLVLCRRNESAFLLPLLLCFISLNWENRYDGCKRNFYTPIDLLEFFFSFIFSVDASWPEYELTKWNLYGSWYLSVVWMLKSVFKIGVFHIFNARLLSSSIKECCV